MGNPIGRRRALWLTGGLLAAPAAGYGLWEALRSDASPSEPAQDAVTGTGLARGTGSLGFVHVIAHPDDNLYFMNPDLDQSVASGAACVTVCLTGGESDGRNVLHAEPGHDRVRPDRPAYTRARINGLAAAYALMATGDENSPWDVQLVSYLDGLQVEQHTLRAAPQVQLIFPALVEARAVSVHRPESLRGLWLGETGRLATLPPAHSGLPAGGGYTRDQLIGTLTGILDHVRPTVVRTLDPNPEHSQQPPKGHPGPLYLDHQDHTYSAYFTQAALARHWGGGKARAGSVESYLGYVNAGLPHNLDRAAVDRKVRLLDAYGWTDNRNCGDPAGCGDRKVGGGALRNGWAQSTRHRAPGSGDWLQPMADGRLAAFTLLNGSVAYWVESGSGWSGPHRIEGGGLEGQLQVLRQADGRLRLLTVRTDPAFEEARHRREIVTCVQVSASDRAFGAWQSLGTPDGDDPVKSMEAGYPLGLALPDGTVQVIARTWSGSVGIRTLDGPWTALTLPAEAGQTVQDGLGAVVDADGRTHVLAAGKTVVHWASDTPGGPLRPDRPTGLPVPSGPVTALLAADGTLRLHYREPKSAKVLTAERRPGSEAWRITGESTPPGGFGRVAATPGALAVRDAKGRVALGHGGDWHHGGPLLAHTPTVGTDGHGRAVAAALGCDGLLYVARQAAKDGPFGAWAQVA
ncbi:PIG-L family deacetylase [Kitasatospora atroaurantiaca]|uniref:GlcNAc-PI de-N-acetylase n=1 Tax=Kitasatospora atroaurantiaca TaxID=285545 RepID=A0A561EVN5_9ACTN|nr:PIG-L family deacetylase [Kitasatospora atroaurantiaca]TWE19674.1 GlcNAc-PI de-N-acetylase [Kitasatospora atroaurantiaca]